MEIAGAGLPALTAHPEVAEALTRQAAWRMRRTDLVAQMVDVFGTADVELLGELEARMDWIRLNAGDVLFRRGELPDAAYFVVAGRLHMVADDEDGGSIPAVVARGELVGETELVDQVPRHHTVHAVRDSDLVRLPAAVFDEMLGRHPTMMLEVARTILRRQRRPARRPEISLTVAVIPARPDIDVVPMATALTLALARFGSAEQIDSLRLDQLAGKEGAALAQPGEPADLHVTHLLDRTEHDTRFVVYRGDATWTGWNGRSIRHADRILIVADGVLPAEQRVDRAVAERVAARADDTTLVLLQPPSTVLPSATRLDAMACAAADHHHVRRGSADDVARLARVLSGRAVSLVLSGGGARGFAHLGVIRALRERRVPVDMVAGSSMGAIMAATVAMEFSDARALEATRLGFTGLLDYTLPVVSLLRGRRIVRSMETTFGDPWIEDLWRPFFCVSTNLTVSRPVVHRRGPAVTALRASVAIPGVLPPVPHDGDLLVDGSVLDNLPLETMRKLNPHGTVIAVDVASGPGPRARADYGLSVSGWRALRHRRTHPRFVATMVRSTLAGALRDRDRMVEGGLADLYLDLDVRGVGLLEFDAVEPVAEHGHLAAAPRLDEWLDNLGRRPWDPPGDVVDAATTGPEPAR